MSTNGGKASRAVATAARELGINEASLGRWVSAFKARNNTGETGITESERAELLRLRKGNADLKLAVGPIDILDGEAARRQEVEMHLVGRPIDGLFDQHGDLCQGEEMPRRDDLKDCVGVRIGVGNGPVCHFHSCIDDFPRKQWGRSTATERIPSASDVNAVRWLGVSGNVEVIGDARLVDR